LRRTADNISRAHPDYVDPASDFAALDRNGLIKLPPEFPLPAFDAQGAQVGVCTTINIAAFTMRSGNTDLSLSSGSIAALAYNTLYYVYEDDPAFAGGAVTYSATTVKEFALYSENRYFVSSIATPSQGSPDTVGNNDGGAGAQVGVLQALRMAFSTSTVGSGTVTSPALATDGDPSTGAVLDAPNGAGTNTAKMIFTIPGGVTFSKGILNLLYQNNISSAAAPSASPVTNSPGTAASVARGGSLASSAWSNPNNVKVYEGGTYSSSYATDGLTTGASLGYGDYLQVTNFGFSIPSTATIVGIVAKVYAWENQGSAKDSSVLIVKGGVITNRRNQPS
jgi:hypothetical protein